MKTKKIIVTADDYGMSHAINKAIEEGIECSFIKSTNIMMNMPYAFEGKTLKNKYPDLSIGLHYNLTTGYPLVESEKVNTLINEKGMFWSVTEFRKKWKQHKIDKKQVKMEIQAQYNAYFNMYGKPDYWNTHQHIHMLPDLFYMMEKINKNYGVGGMRCNKHIFIQNSKKDIKEAIKNFAKGVMYLAINGKTKRPDGIIVFKNNIDKCNVEKWVSKINWGKKICIELILHPAIECDSTYFGILQSERIAEYKFSINPLNRDCFEKNNIKLCGFEIL